MCKRNYVIGSAILLTILIFLSATITATSTVPSGYKKIDNGTTKANFYKTYYENNKWTTYKYNSGVYVDGYVTTNKAKYLYYVHYYIKQYGKGKLKISMYTPWLEYMYGCSPIVRYKKTSLTPTQFYSKHVKTYLRKHGFEDPKFF